MIGQRRLINIEWALRRVISLNVPGDFMECGVWRGGGSVFARAVFKALNVHNRHLWLADSFQGLPKARTSNDDDGWSTQEYLKVHEQRLLAKCQRNAERELFCMFRCHWKKFERISKPLIC